MARSKDFSLYLLEHANVATVTGEAFGNPNCIRISYAASENELKEAIKQNGIVVLKFVVLSPFGMLGEP